MQVNSKYSKLSLSGKWIALARLWLCDNAPCSREFMFVELGAIMPTTVRIGPVLATREKLVAEAHRRIYGTSDIPPEIPKPASTGMRKTGATDTLRSMLATMPFVVASDTKVYNAPRLLGLLAAKGEAIRISRGCYKKTENLKS
jgi:hypothetical protein